MHLPTLNAILNCLSAVLLLAGRWAVAHHRIPLHRNLMRAAFGVSTAFLVSYLIHHAQAGSTKFLGAGWVRPVYFSILISHTILAAAIVPLIFRTLWLALHDRFEDHKRWATWTWPLWMYVSATGVVIYVMLYHLGT